MILKARLILFGSIGGFFLLFDQLLKYLARSAPDFTWYLVKPWLGWEYFENSGIAFSLPIPNWFVLLTTPTVLLILFSYLFKNFYKSFFKSAALMLIIAGAISNYIDRVLFGFTIDYFRILTSVINIGDVMILVGVLMLFIRKNVILQMKTRFIASLQLFVYHS